MHKPALNDFKRKHKSQFYTVNPSLIKSFKSKRKSCMGVQELQMIEESQIQNVKYAIESILARVYGQIDQSKIVSKICFTQLQQQVALLLNLEIYNIGAQTQQEVDQIMLQTQPINQYQHKVLGKRQKDEYSSGTMHFNTNHKDTLMIPQLTNSISSNSKTNKFISKGKSSSKLTSIYGSSVSSKSIASNKSARGNSHGLNPYKLSGKIEEEKQSSRSREKRLKQDLVKKLMRQYQSKLKETKHCCPQPILQNYRSFFTQPEPRDYEDFRASFLHLRQMKSNQQKISLEGKTRKTTNLSIVSGQDKQNVSTRLPIIQKPTKGKKQIGNLSLFSQDYDGQVIKIKNQQRLETFTRDHSSTTHENFHKIPQQTALKEISNTYKVNYEYLKNQKIKEDSTLLNNLSITSTMCQSMDEQMLQKSLIQTFNDRKGIRFKKPNFSHRSSASLQIQSLKLPSIMLKRVQ